MFAQFVPGYPPQPSPKIFPLPKPVQTPVRSNQGFLSEIIDGIQLVQMAGQVRPHPWRIPMHQPKKRITVSFQHPLHHLLHILFNSHLPILPTQGPVLTEFSVFFSCSRFFLRLGVRF
jgi:hypothetical protein